MGGGVSASRGGVSASGGRSLSPWGGDAQHGGAHLLEQVSFWFPLHQLREVAAYLAGGGVSRGAESRYGGGWSQQ